MYMDSVILITTQTSILAQKTRLYNTIYNFSKKPNKMEDHLKIPGAEKPHSKLTVYMLS
jgi:hypothetical protein